MTGGNMLGNHDDDDDDGQNMTMMMMMLSQNNLKYLLIFNHYHCIFSFPLVFYCLTIMYNE